MSLDHLKIVTCGDAAWLTRGFHSQNATYTLRNYQTSALL